MLSLIDAWLIYLSGAPIRLTYSEIMNPSQHHDYMGVYGRYFTDILLGDGIEHEVMRNLAFIDRLGGTVTDDSLELWTNDKDRKIVQKMFRTENIDMKKPIIIINISTSVLSNDWPTDRYIKLVRAINKKFMMNYVMIGAGEKAQKYASEFKAVILEAYDFVNKTTIPQTIEVIRHGDVYIGGNTGPAHFAAACKLTGVVIYKAARDCRVKMEDFPRRLYPWQATLVIVQPEHESTKYSGMSDNQASISQVSVQPVYDKVMPIVEQVCSSK